MKNVRPEVQALKSELIATRRQLHQQPELAFQEFETAKLVSEQLSSLGLEVKTEIARTGVVATLEGAQSGPTLLLRADMDALPIEEETGASYASQQPGKMHACGHDGHTAILLATAKYLCPRKAQLKGRVRFLFQPAEEGPGGAAPMIEEGVLDGVDAAVGLHLWSQLPTGSATVCSGPMMAAADEFRVSIRGKGCHAAQPHLGVDPILIGAQMVQQLQTITARDIDPLEAAVLTVSKFQAGTAYNVIPSSAEIGGTVRTFKEEVRIRVRQRMATLLEYLARAHEAEVEFTYKEGYPPLVNDPQMTSVVEAACRDVLDLPSALPDARTLGGEDMAYYLQKVPGCFFLLGSGNSKKNTTYGHHHPKFDLDEDALVLGVELFLRIAERFCSQGLAHHN